MECKGAACLAESGQGLLVAPLLEVRLADSISQKITAGAPCVPEGRLAHDGTRRVLAEHAQASLAERRGGGAECVELLKVESALDETPEALVALEAALERFAQVNPMNARIVELRWFAGLDVEAIAAILDVSTRTVERRWRAARAWLRERVQSELG